jgi:hypothetical protein
MLDDYGARLAGAGLDGGALEENEGASVPLFSIETLEKQASHGQGAITAVAAASNCVLLGTATGALIRYDFAEGAATGEAARCSGAVGATLQTP